VRNVTFFRHGRWVTPHDSTGCLPGVMRRWLLEQRLVVTGDRGWLEWSAPGQITINHMHFQLLTPSDFTLFHQVRFLLHRADSITATIAPISPLSADPVLAARISPSM